MADTTKIEWTDATWSPLRVRVRADAAEVARAKGYTSLVPIAERMAGRVGAHCEHVSPGCEHCYAGTNNARCLPANGTGLPYDRRSRDLVESFVDEAMLQRPLGWKRGRRIFVENQSDIFGEWVTDEQLDRVFAVMALCPQHTFQVLTKRPERMRAYLQQVSDERDMQRWVNAAVEVLQKQIDAEGEFENSAHAACRRAQTLTEDWEWPLPNVWLGVSVENQEQADKRIPLLLQTPAAVRFVSAEPLLGPVDLKDALGLFWAARSQAWKKLPLFDSSDGGRAAEGGQPRYKGMAEPSLDWVIVGGESGPGARPMHPDWGRSLRDQCAAADVKFFFKQWGEWLETDGPRCRSIRQDSSGERRYMNVDGSFAEGSFRSAYKQSVMTRVGKKAAGRLLDGVEHSALPEVRA